MLKGEKLVHQLSCPSASEFLLRQQSVQYWVYCIENTTTVNTWSTSWYYRYCWQHKHGSVSSWHVMWDSVTSHQRVTPVWSSIRIPLDKVKGQKLQNTTRHKTDDAKLPPLHPTKEMWPTHPDIFWMNVGMWKILTSDGNMFVCARTQPDYRPFSDFMWI